MAPSCAQCVTFQLPCLAIEPLGGLVKLLKHDSYDRINNEKPKDARFLVKLPRGQIYQFHLMLVVMRPSVDQVSEYHILQKLSSTVLHTVRYYFWVRRAKCTDRQI